MSEYRLPKQNDLERDAVFFSVSPRLPVSVSARSTFYLPQQMEGFSQVFPPQKISLAEFPKKEYSFLGNSAREIF